MINTAAQRVSQSDRLWWLIVLMVLTAGFLVAMALVLR